MHRSDIIERGILFVLGVTARAFFLFRKKPLAGDSSIKLARSFFLIRPEGLGDIILTLPAISYLRSQNPSASITMGVVPPFVDFLKQMQVVDEVISMSYPKRNGFSLAKLWSFLRQVYGLHKRYDVAFDFRGDLRNAIIGAWSSQIVIGQTSAYSAFLLSATEPPSFEYSRAIHNLRVVSAGSAGSPFIGDFEAGYDFNIDAEALNRTKAILGTRTRFIILHPGASRPSNQWPVEHWAELAARLLGDGEEIVFTGTRGKESQVIAKIIEAFDGPKDRLINLAGQTNCTEMAAVIKMGSMLVSPDTGVSHIAHAVRTRSVTLFGSGSELTGGYTTSINKAVTTRLWCRPCRKFDCPRLDAPRECMSLITVDAVYDQLRRVMP